MVNCLRLQRDIRQPHTVQTVATCHRRVLDIVEARSVELWLVLLLMVPAALITN